MSTDPKGSSASTKPAENVKAKAKPVAFKKRKRKRGNVRERTIHNLEDAESGVKIPQIKSKLSQKLSANALVATSSERTKSSQSHLDTVASERSAMPAETADKHNSMTITAQKRDKNKPKWVGPRKAPANIRMTTVIDYNPSLCKDYNETGFCGYGDSCKFLHDRGDYKGGWQLEKEWEEKQKREKAKLMGEEVSDEEDYAIDSDEDLPFACYICREDFKNPVVTRCEHYFCEECALKRYAKNKGCAVCKQPTSGFYKTAHKIIEKMKRKKEAEEKEEAEGGDVATGVQGEASSGWTIPGGQGRFKHQKRV